MKQKIIHFFGGGSMGFVFDGCNLIRITFGIWFYFGCLITGPSTLVGLVILPKPNIWNPTKWRVEEIKMFLFFFFIYFHVNYFQVPYYTKKFSRGFFFDFLCSPPILGPNPHPKWLEVLNPTQVAIWWPAGDVACKRQRCCRSIKGETCNLRLAGPTNRVRILGYLENIWVLNQK